MSARAGAEFGPRRIGVDVDGVIADIDKDWKIYQLQVDPSRTTLWDFEPAYPDAPTDPGYRELRQTYLRDSARIPGLPFHRGALSSLALAWHHFDHITLNTARLINQRPYVESLLKRGENGKEEDYAKYVHEILMRSPEIEYPNLAKLSNAIKSDLNFMVEDNGELAIMGAEFGMKVVMIERPWNRWVPRLPNLIQYPELIDFMQDLISRGAKPEEIFEEHNEKYAVHGIDSFTETVGVTLKARSAIERLGLASHLPAPRRF